MPEQPRTLDTRSQPSGLLLVTAALATVLCIGGASTAAFGGFPQSSRPMFRHGPGNSPTGTMGTHTTTPTNLATPTATPAATIAPSPAVSYASCADAWTAGAAPLHAGQPGYRSELDPDRDGVACEKPGKER